MLGDLVTDMPPYSPRSPKYEARQAELLALTKLTQARP